MLNHYFLRKTIKNFYSFLNKISEINNTDVDYKKAILYTEEFLEDISDYKLFNSFTEAMNIEIISHCIFVKTGNKDRPVLFKEDIEFFNQFFPIDYYKDYLNTYFNKIGLNFWNNQYFPFMFETIAKVDGFLDIKYKEKRLYKTYLVIFKSILKKYLKYQNLNVKFPIIKQYNKTINKGANTIIAAYQIQNKYQLIAEFAAFTILKKKANTLTHTDFKEEDGEITIPRSTLGKRISDNIFFDLKYFVLFLIKSSFKNNCLTFYEELFLRQLGCYDINILISDFPEEWINKMPESLLNMMQTDKYKEKFHRKTYFKYLLNEFIFLTIKFVTIDLKSSFNKEKIYNAIQHISLIKTFHKKIKSYKRFDPLLIKKFDKFCDFIDHTPLEPIINKLSKKEKYKQYKNDKTLGLIIENDLILLLFFLSSYRKTISRLSQIEKSIFLSFFGKNIDYKLEYKRFNSAIKDEFFSYLPDSITILCEYDLMNKKDVKYSIELYNFFIDIGQEYLKCIYKLEIPEHNKFSYYMLNIYDAIAARFPNEKHDLKILVPKLNNRSLTNNNKKKDNSKYYIISFNKKQKLPYLNELILDINNNYFPYLPKKELRDFKNSNESKLYFDILNDNANTELNIRELRRSLSYIDQILEYLPEDKIDEFESSKYYNNYKILFKELGLI